MNRRFLVLAARPWAERLFDETLRWLPGGWSVARDPVELAAATVAPDRIFSLHWHWRLMPYVTESCYCVGFHASDLPHFRGGDPIGNQIKRGVLDTTVTAFRIDGGWDTGPILMKLPLSLRGTRDEVLERCMGLVARMIPSLAYHDLPAIPQPPGGSFYTRKDAL